MDDMDIEWIEKGTSGRHTKYWSGEQAVGLGKTGIYVYEDTVNHIRQVAGGLPKGFLVGVDEDNQAVFFEPADPARSKNAYTFRKTKGKGNPNTYVIGSDEIARRVRNKVGLSGKIERFPIDRNGTGSVFYLKATENNKL
jgi:hypothetical protein